VSGHRDLRRACLAAIVCGGLALALPVGFLSLLFLAPLAFYLTGYALVAAAFARQPLEKPQAALFSVALSLAVLAVGALPLNYLPGGIRAGWWALALVLVVFAGCGVAARRRPAPPRRSRPAARPLPRPGAAVVLGFTLAFLCAGVAVAASFVPLPADKAIGYTELWALPGEEGKADVEIGISSEEQDTRGYELRVALPGRRQVFHRRFSLDPGERWLLPLSLDEPVGEGRVLRAVLFRDDLPRVPYRRVVLRGPPGGGE